MGKRFLGYSVLILVLSFLTGFLIVWLRSQFSKVATSTGLRFQISGKKGYVVTNVENEGYWDEDGNWIWN